MEKKYITPEELAERWSIAVGTIYNRVYARKDVPRFFKAGRFVRFTLEDVEQFEQEHLFETE